MDATQPTPPLCDWCNVNPATHPNGECDTCWHLPGHEGENEPTLEEEAYRQRYEALENLIAECCSLRDVMNYPDGERILNEVRANVEARELLKGGE